MAGGRDLRPHRPFRLPAGGIYSILQRQPPTKELWVFAALLLSFGVIFVAELGDNSQLMAMTFALRYRW